MEQRVPVEAKVADVMAVSSVLDQLDNFNQNLKELTTKYNMADIMHHLKRATKGESTLFRKRGIYQFYQENKDTVDTIDKNSDIFMFLSLNYKDDGTMKTDLSYYYEYLLNHNDEKQRIQALLQELQRLNIREITLNEEADFTKEEYHLEMWYYCPILNPIVYLENIKVLPNYEKNTIKYHSKRSNYKLLIGNERFKHSINKIVVNNMTFPIECLPASTSYDIIRDSILSLAKGTKESKKALQNAVDLDVSLQDLDAQMADTCNTFTRIDEVNSKPELVAALTQIQTGIAALYGIKRDYEAEITIENPSLSQQTIKEETKQYVKRRDSMIDID